MKYCTSIVLAIFIVFYTSVCHAEAQRDYKEGIHNVVNELRIGGQVHTTWGTSRHSPNSTTEKTTLVSDDKLPIWDSADSDSPKYVEVGNAPWLRVFNVKSYGAVGDGITDDTTAIQSAITAAEAYISSRLYFPDGDYLVTSSLQFKADGLLVDGVPWFNWLYNITPTGGSRIVWGGAAGGTVISAASDLIASAPTDPIYDLTTNTVIHSMTIRNLIIDGYDGNGGNVAAKVLHAVKHVGFKLENVLLRYSTDVALHIDAGQVGFPGGVAGANDTGEQFWHGEFNNIQVLQIHADLGTTTGECVRIDSRGNLDANNLVFNNLVVYPQGSIGVNIKAAEAIVFNNFKAFYGYTGGVGAFLAAKYDYGDFTQFGAFGIEFHHTQSYGIIVAGTDTEIPENPGNTYAGIDASAAASSGHKFYDLDSASGGLPPYLGSGAESEWQFWTKNSTDGTPSPIQYNKSFGHQITSEGSITGREQRIGIKYESVAVTVRKILRGMFSGADYTDANWVLPFGDDDLGIMAFTWGGGLTMADMPLFDGMSFDLSGFTNSDNDGTYTLEWAWGNGASIGPEVAFGWPAGHEFDTTDIADTMIIQPAFDMRSWTHGSIVLESYSNTLDALTIIPPDSDKSAFGILTIKNNATGTGTWMGIDAATSAKIQWAGGVEPTWNTVLGITDGVASAGVQLNIFYSPLDDKFYISYTHLNSSNASILNAMTFTGTSGVPIGISSGLILNATGNSSATPFSLSGSILKSDNFDYSGKLIPAQGVNTITGSGDVEYATGFLGTNYVSNAGATGNVWIGVEGIGAYLSNGATATWTTGGYFQGNVGGSPGTSAGITIADSTGTPTVQYGIYIANMTAGTSKYSIYSLGGQGYHVGNFDFGGGIDVTGNITGTGSISLTTAGPVTTAITSTSIGTTTNDVFKIHAFGTSGAYINLGNSTNGGVEIYARGIGDLGLNVSTGLVKIAAGTLWYGGTVTSDYNELNILDASVTNPTTLTLADGDGVVVQDVSPTPDVTHLALMSDVNTYIESKRLAGQYYMADQGTPDNQTVDVAGFAPTDVIIDATGIAMTGVSLASNTLIFATAGTYEISYTVTILETDAVTSQFYIVPTITGTTSYTTDLGTGSKAVTASKQDSISNSFICTIAASGTLKLVSYREDAESYEIAMNATQISVNKIK